MLTPDADPLVSIILTFTGFFGSVTSIIYNPAIPSDTSAKKFSLICIMLTPFALPLVSILLTFTGF